MAEETMVQGTEGIVATPKQEAFNLQNQASFNNPIDIKLSAYDPSITKESMNNSFQTNEDWRNFLADEKRYVKTDAPQNYKSFRQIEKMWRQPEFASIVDMYGSDMAVAGQMLSDYVDWDKVPWWEKQKLGVRAAWYGMKIGAAKTNLRELEHNGASPEDIQAAKDEVSRLEEYFQHNARPYDSDTANAIASFGASFARVVPEMVLTSAAISATGGLASAASGKTAARIAMALGNATRGAKNVANIAKGLRAARTAKQATNVLTGTAQSVAGAGLVFNDTYKVTMGDVYDKVKAENPLLSDDQVYDLANTSANIQAAFEAAPALLGLGFRAATSAELGAAFRSIATKVPKDVLQRAAFMKTFKEATNEIVGKKIAAGWAKDTLADTLTEVAQEAAEIATLKVAEGGGEADDILSATLSRLGGFVMDPLNPEYEKELDTLLTTLPAAALFGGAAPSVAYARHKVGQKSMGNRLSDLYKNQKFGADLRNFTQQNKDKMGPQAINELITGMGNRGDAPTSVYFDRAAVQELADTDADFRNAMDRLGVMRQLVESEGNGGVVEIDLATYNTVVNGEDSGVLYSKVKDMVTFSIDSMTMSQLNQWLASVEAQNKAEIKKAIADENSVYNKTMKYLAEIANMTEDQRKANATLMQLLANRVASSRANPITGEQWFEENVLLTRGEREQFGKSTEQTQKEKQFTIIQQTNPSRPDGQQTWINSVEDIKTLQETLQDSNYKDYDSFTPDLSRADIDGAIKSGKITVYSSHPIENGAFVTPSKMLAKDYAGDGKIYSKKVNTSDVAWIDPTQGQFAQQQKQGSLFQKNKDVVAGWFDVIDGKYVVGLTDNWNATTFSHEAFHLYSRALQDEYNNGTMTSYWKSQTKKMFKAVDAKPNKQGKIKLTKNQEELLAERFTTYLLENKIENPELNSIFALLRDAFDKTYKQLNLTKHEPDKKTKEAFAVIFGAQDVAAAEQRALGLLEIEKPDGVSQEAYDHYMSFLLESRAKASHDMVKTYYAVEKYKKSKEYGELYDTTYTANLQVVEKEPRFQMKAIAKEINSTNPDDVMMAYNATHPEALATAEEVVAMLDDPAKLTEVAEARTAEMMDEHIKEKFNIKDDQTLVSKDLKNVAMAKAFLMEALMNENKDWKDFDSEYTKLLNAVDNQIQKMPLSKLQNSRRWSQLESVYAQQYQMYSSVGQKERAAKVRRAQAQVVLIQNKMFEMNNRVDRFLEKFPKKLRNAQPQGKSVMSAESWDLLQSLMEQYGFKILDKRRSAEPFNIKLDDWLANIEDSEFCPISNLRYFFPETAQGHKGPFGAMNVRQFEVLEHVATAINSLASREYNLITEAEKIKYDTLVALTAKRLQDKGIKPYEKTDSWWRKNFGILSNIVNPEPILKALFPEEVMQALVRPLFSAAAREEVTYNKWNDRWNEMIKNVNLSDHKKKYAAGKVLSYNGVGNLLLAMGNEHAYENWRLFLGIDESQAESIVTEALAEQPRLAEFANKYWELMSETSDLMNDSYRKRYNKLFVKKQPRAFKIGQYEFTGGYVPESKLVSPLAENEGWESIVMGELSNEKLVDEKPDGKDLLSIVDNTRSRLKLFARWGHVAPEFNNFVRFVQREDVGAVIGTRAQNYIKGWLRDYHTPAGDSAGLMHALMAATTTGVLGLRLPQALLQLSGFIPAMGLLGRGGIRYMAGSIGRALAEGGLAHQVQSAAKKSDYMEARYADPVKTLFGVSEAEMHISKAVGKFQKVAMSMISYMDAIVSNATWDASYRMSIDNGLTQEQAREKADQDVRLSQTDALTISRSRAMKSDWARIITPFSTYMMGMQSVVRGRIAENEYMGALTFFISYTVVSTLLESMLKEVPMPWEDDDDENYIDKVLNRWYNDGVSTLGSTAYPIAGLGSYAAKKAAWTVEKILDPDEKTAIETFGSGALAAISYAQQFPDALSYGMVGIFNGDEDSQRKAIANFVGWFSSGGKKMIKEVTEE